MPVDVAGPDRDQGQLWCYRVEELLSGARAAAVVRHLENVGAQAFRLAIEEPGLFVTFGVARQEHRDASYLDARDGARVVGICKGVRPYRIRRKERNANLVDDEGVARSDATPAGMRALRRDERGAVGAGAPRIPGIEVGRRLESLN